VPRRWEPPRASAHIAPRCASNQAGFAQEVEDDPGFASTDSGTFCDAIGVDDPGFFCAIGLVWLCRFLYGRFTRDLG